MASISVFPVGSGEHLSRYVAEALEAIEAHGIDHRHGPMGTVLEGELSQVMAVAEACVRRLEKTCPRVYMTLSLDHRPGRSGGMEGKVRSVRRALDDEK